MALLRAVARGEVAPEGALDQLALAPFEAVADASGDVATVDHHRALRQGVPEVVYGAGKSPAQAVAIVERLAARGEGFLVTRADDAMRAALLAAFPAAVENALGRTVRLAPDEPVRAPDGRVCIVTAGTADLPVAEECAETLRSAGVVADRVTDVGVAGVHRLLARAAQLAAADVVIVIAGMDGALPSAVGGMVGGAVIAVPTSVGYGASFAGLAPLLTMLNSCAAGITVVNIDNGFGAAMAALRILASRATSDTTSNATSNATSLATPDASCNAKPGNEFRAAI